MIRIPHLDNLVQPLQKVFARPGRALMENTFIGRILCPSRRFITSIFHFGDLERTHAHDAYHRFFRTSAWLLPLFFRMLSTIIIGACGHRKIPWLLGDDMVHKKTGRTIEGAKYGRDSVRSTAQKVVNAWGLQIVLLCLEVRKPIKRKPGQRGRSRMRGERLPTPSEIALNATGWKLVSTVERGRQRMRLILVRHVIWHAVMPGKYFRLIISRDPDGKERDDFFFPTALTTGPGTLISGYSDRCAIEDTFRNGKQFLGIEQPQSCQGSGSVKVAAMGYAVYALVWCWFIKNGDYFASPSRPWYQTKTTPSFQDALAGIRHQIWSRRISHVVPRNPELHKLSEIMIESLSRAA